MTAKILLIDIETAPNKGYTWGKWEQDVLEFTDHWYILCFAYKWLGDKTSVVSVSDFKGYKAGKTKDEKLIKNLWSLLDEADIVIAQNGDAFDFKKINTRFLQHRLLPPSPFRTIDTLKVARKRFGFNSNKLDEIGRDLDEGRKIQHRGVPLWLDCMAGNKKAWQEMKEYNRQDVELLERVYKRFLPWINNHPNLGLFTEGSACPKCGGKNLVRRGYQFNQTTKYQRIQCNDCGGWSRFNLNLQEQKPLISL